MSAVKSNTPESSAAASPKPAAEHDSVIRGADVNDALHSGNFLPQCKLVVGAPDDPYEREADSVADRVMRMPEPTVQRQGEMDEEEPVQPKRIDTSFIQRVCACDNERIQRQEEEEEEEVAQPKLITGVSFIQRQCEECKKEQEIPLPVTTTPFIQTKASGTPGPASDSVRQAIHSSRGGGSSMDASTHSFMSRRIGADFSGVKIHADNAAVQPNRELNARAFTVGNNIYFNEGQYQPHTDDGKRLLAHELTHVVQQGKATSLQTKVFRKVLAPAAPNGTVCDQYVAPPSVENAPMGTATEDNTNIVSQTPPPPSPPANKNKAAEAKPAPLAIAEKPQEASALPTAGNSPADADPAFREVLADTKKKAHKQKNHEKPDKKTTDATNAVHVEDPDAVKSGTTVLTVDGEVNSADKPPREFNAEKFKRELKEKIISQVPQEERGARDFIKDDSKANGIVSETKTGIKDSEKEVVNDAEKISNKGSADMSQQEKLAAGNNIAYTPEASGNRPAIKDPQRAVPKPAPEEDAQMDEEHDADSLDRKMAQNNLTDNQLAESEEPKFIETLEEKQKSQQELCQVPATMRAAEAKQMQGNTTEAQAMMSGAMGAMFGKRKGQLGEVAKGQQHVQTEEEKQLQHYFNQLKQIYQTTEKNVKNTLTYLECMVACTFQDAIDKAFSTFKTNVTDRLDYYYDWQIVNPDYEKEDKMTRAFVNAPIEEKIWKLTWKQSLLDPADPKRLAIANDIKRLQNSKAKLRIEMIFEEEKALFISSLDSAIDKIATMVANGLNEAKAYISKGKSAMDAEYAILGKDNQERAKDATEDFRSKLTDLEERVHDKEAELSDSLVKQYTESTAKLKSAFEEIRQDAALKWWERAWRKIKEIATIIFDIAKLLLKILVKAAGVIGDIVAHPIRFFGNLIEAVSAGFKNFVRRLPEHLEAIIFKLVVGVVPAGVTLPEKWDAEGLFSFVLDFLGLSKMNIREQAVKRFGLPVVEKLEEGFELFVIFRDKGFAGLWEHIKEQIGNLKDAIIEEVKTFFKESIIKAAVEFLISALTPASGFIKVCKSIINLVMFFIKNLQNILKLLESILDSFADVAVGKIEKAAHKIETAIADILLIGIKFLAALVGINLDKIQSKITKIINAVRNPVNRALKWFFDKAEAFAQRTGLLGLIKKGKKRFEAGKDWAKGKVEKGKEKVKEIKERIMAWWKMRKEMKFENGETHTLYFAGIAPNVVLMIKSTPISYKKYIKSIVITTKNAAEKKKQESAKSSALKIAIELDQLIVKGKRLQRSGDTRDISPEFQDKLDALARLTIIFSKRDDGKLPVSTQPEYGPLYNGFATSMHIKKLTKLGPAGTKVSVENSIMNDLLLRKEQVRTYYIAGHLLNNNLHGPGFTWQNLTPLTQKANAEHLRWIEAEIKFAVNHGRVFNYRVTVIYGRSENKTLIKQIEQSNAKNAATKAQIVRAEKYVPTEIVANLREVDFDGKEIKTGDFIAADMAIENDIDQNSPASYKL